MFKPTDHELKLLRYLHQHGLTERRSILLDCASDASLIAARASGTTGKRRFYQGSNGAAPMIVARWMKRMLATGMVRERRDADRSYVHIGYELTSKGDHFLRDHHGKREA